MDTDRPDPDAKDLPSLEAQAARQLEELRATLAEIGRLSGSVRGGAEGAVPVTRSRPKPVREVVLDALEDLRWPAYARELSLYAGALLDRPIPATRFGPLSADERKSFERASGSQPVWLCHALTWNRGEAIKRLWARSDWPLECRVVAPTTGRVQHLKMTSRLCEIAMAMGDRDDAADHVERLSILAADHARDVPGIAVRRGEFPLAEWLAIAGARLDELEPRDAELRADAAQALRRRLGDGSHLLFGVPESVDGGAADLVEVAR